MYQELKLAITLKRVLDKWHVLFRIGRSWSQFGYSLSFGVGKFTSFPEPGEIIQLEHHDGVFVTVEFWVPMTFRRWSWVLRLGGKRRVVGFSLPIGIRFKWWRPIRVW